VLNVAKKCFSLLMRSWGKRFGAKSAKTLWTVNLLTIKTSWTGYRKDNDVGKPTTLTCKRLWFTDKSTISELFIGNEFQCFVLEDKVRDVKIAGVTAIPYGKYEIVLSYSDKFNALLPLLLNVPNYVGVRIHSGNIPEHTEGCPLPGMIKDIDFVGDSRKAFGMLFPKIRAAMETGKVFWEIIDGRTT
jgi:hypothetical protein